MASPNVQHANDDGLPVFQFELVPADDSDSNLRIKNNPNDLYGRTTYVNQNDSRVRVNCASKGVASGFLSPGSKDLGTLIVLEFRFGSLKNQARIKSVTATLEFEGGTPEAPTPEVIRVAPGDHYTLEPSSQAETVETEAGAELGLGMEGLPELKANISRGKTTERTTTDAMTVEGFPHWAGTETDQANAAQFVVKENPTTKRGVPARMQAAILVRRADMAVFRAKVDVRVEADSTTQLWRRLTSLPRDDPVNYNPALPPRGCLEGCDTSALDPKEDFEKLFEAWTTTNLGNTTRERNQ